MRYSIEVAYQVSKEQADGIDQAAQDLAACMNMSYTNALAQVLSVLRLSYYELGRSLVDGMTAGIFTLGIDSRKPSHRLTRSHTSSDIGQPLRGHPAVVRHRTSHRRSH